MISHRGGQKNKCELDKILSSSIWGYDVYLAPAFHHQWPEDERHHHNASLDTDNTSLSLLSPSRHCAHSLNLKLRVWGCQNIVNSSLLLGLHRNLDVLLLVFSTSQNCPETFVFWKHELSFNNEILKTFFLKNLVSSLTWLKRMSFSNNELISISTFVVWRSSKQNCFCFLPMFEFQVNCTLCLESKLCVHMREEQHITRYESYLGNDWQCNVGLWSSRQSRQDPKTT